VTRQLQVVGGILLALFVALFVNLNYLQVLRADELANDDRNARQLIREYEIRRGLLIAGDGSTELARVEETDGPLRYRREYSDGPLYAHATGYHSLVFGRSELESSFNDYLLGSAPETFGRNLVDLLAGRERAGDDLLTTLRPAVQQAAFEALDGRRGAVVALEPRTGEILALVSSPSYDPNRLSTHDSAEANAYWDELQEDPDRPLVNRAVREWYAPGSSFKLVTAAAALDNGVSPDASFPDPVALELPQTTATIRNFGRGVCADGGSVTLSQALVVSCNTTFGQLGLDLGAGELAAQAEAFGFNDAIISQLPSPLNSRFPGELNPPQTAQAAIGQFDVRATPLQMALVAAAVGNNGVLMEPHLVRGVLDDRGQEVARFGAEPFAPTGRPNAQALSQQAAAHLRDMMVEAVASGTGTNARIDGVDVAGKTGTAEGGEGPPTVWFAGFAPAASPTVAVAVVLEEGGGAGDGATGGSVAAPVARVVLEAALAAAED
jgi:penicillin-binding protein A